MVSRFIQIRGLFFKALLLALGLIFLFPTSSQAHAVLIRSDPQRDAVLALQPSHVHLWFSEDLNPAFSTALVVNQANQRVDAGDAHPSDIREIDVSLRPHLPPGVYVVVWRTQSAADGHVLSGSFLFSLANPDGSIPQVTGTLPGQNLLSTSLSTGQLDGPGFFSLLMVTLVDLGTIFWVGAQLWRNFVVQGDEASTPEQRRSEELAIQRFDNIFAFPVLILLLLANLGVLIGQGLSVTGGQWGQVFTPQILGGLIGNGRFGTYWIAREVVIGLALLVSLYTLLSARRSRLAENVVHWSNLILSLALLIATTLSGHAAAVDANIIVFAALSDWLHLLAASLWIGGMLYISIIYLPALASSPPLQQARPLLTTVSRFSPLAIAGVILMALTGPFNATVHMSSFNQLWETAYGRALVVKILLVLALLLTSAWHIRVLRPRLAGDERRYEESLAATDEEQPVLTVEERKVLESSIMRQNQRLQNVLRWEPLLGVAVLLCTGLMNVFAGTLLPTTTSQTQTQTPKTTAKPFNTTLKTSDNQFTVQLNITPNHFGPNQFTVTVLDSAGKQTTDVGVSIYTTMLDMDMGTDTVNLQRDGKGNFSAIGDLGMSGNWQLRIQIRAPDNKLHEARTKLFTPF